MLVCLQTAFLISSIDIYLSKSSSLLFGNCASYCVLSGISPYSELKCSCRSRMDMCWLHELFGLLSQDLIDLQNYFGCRLAIVSSILPLFDLNCIFAFLHTLLYFVLILVKYILFSFVLFLFN